MALRLTGITTTPAGPEAATGQSAEMLSLQARAALARGDVDGYAALFALADQPADPQRRFQARLALLEAGLGATATVSEAVAARIFVATAHAALTALESEPAEPLALNLAGVALYELWSLDAAGELFKAARRLDPALSDAERNLRELAQRKRSGVRPTRPLHSAVPGLARRARAVAGRARPASGLTLSLCMIVRDEEQMLPRCLAAVAPAVDEIVVVDTGSVDATIEIARSFGARVIEHPWTGSFAEARNVSFAAATGDWLLYLDADEVLVADDVTALRSLTGHTWREAFYLVETSYTGELDYGAAVVNNALRIFRNRPEYRFKDRLHEQIFHALPTYVPGRLEQTAVRIQHYGYLGAVREAKEKSRRNVELLRQQAAENPETAFLRFNLGSEYAAAGDAVAAVPELRRAQSLLREEGSLRTTTYAPALISRLVTVLREAGRTEEARDAAAEGLELFGDFTDLVLAQARIAHAGGELDEAARLYERCIELGDGPASYGAEVGAGTFLPRLGLAALQLSRGDSPAARATLAYCAEHHPGFLAAAAPYAAAMLRDGAEPGEVTAALERFDALPPAVRLVVARELRGAGAQQAAEEQYRLALAASPANARVLTELAELLLARGAWDEAAELAGRVPDEDPGAGLACRIQLCGLIGRAQPEAVHAALARAPRVGLPGAEREVFTAWAAIAAGSAAPEGLSVACAPLLGVLLQTLLAGGDGERFTALLPALQRSRLERREQRELLAEMYLANGLLAQAAQEWMAVCSAHPDVRSLLGLARVALGHGMPADAATFAAGALELDPGSEPARQLLDGLKLAGAVPVAS